MKLFYLLLLISISSCTITKRVHQPGYHVQWNKQLSKSFEKEVLQTKEHEETLTTEIIESNEENETIDLTTSDLTQKENDVDEITDVVKSEKKKAFYLNPSPSITIKKVFAEKNDQKATIHSIKKSTTSENGNTANILAIVSFVLSILTILAIVFSFLSYVPSFGFLLPLFGFVSAIVTAICSLVIGRTNSDTYTLKALAIVSIYLMFAFFLILLLLFAFIVLLFGMF
ncbi:MAG: hypothetical protein NWS40_05400 [Crocinitomicaceae bacterium]|jgi:hypothetical protein|nr:hypothetical protein [Crocinitomicaceae bacterium]MDP4866860.1 hypothetical protein [Crocinitomicaceae bacterium]MDP5010119.1 hypothetical protein [Crocinitomicaceae bacterium]